MLCLGWVRLLRRDAADGGFVAAAGVFDKEDTHFVRHGNWLICTVHVLANVASLQVGYVLYIHDLVLPGSIAVKLNPMSDTANVNGL